MATKTSEKKISREKIVSLYMNYALEHEGEPKSVYRFCKDVKLSEEVFYQHFGSIDSLKEVVWNMFFSNTSNLLEKNAEYESFSNRDKMLTFFFSFFELLGKNRSYVLFALDQHKGKLENLTQLKGLRKHFKIFASELIEETNADKNLKVAQHNPKIFSEGAWLQLLFLLRFWIKDSSPGFENTDLAIEKSVRTIFDVFDNSILESIVDFGKFLYKSNFS